MRDFKKNVRRMFPLLMVGLLVATLIVSQKFLYLSSEPKGEKDCSPLYPNYLEDPSKITNLQMENFPSSLPWIQHGGEINDAGCLDRTSVYGIIKVRSEQDIKNALIYAGEKGLKVSMAGVRHSMGGQAFVKSGLVLDMTGFSGIQLDENAKTVRVQSGATWHQIQNQLHPKFAVKAMQSTDIFTVGGSISVNAHGMDHKIGALKKTIKSMRIMLPSGDIKIASPVENPDLFNLVIGGYGLFGVILDAELEITDNDVYAYTHQIIDYRQFSDTFSNKINSDPSVGLFYAHLSTAPSSFLKEMILYSYKKSDNFEGDVRPLTEVSNIKMRRFFLNFAKSGGMGSELKWFAERNVEGLIESCLVNRNQALKDGESCFISRNEPMHDSVPYLKNNLKNDTDILHEYFIPREKFVEFVDQMRPILENSGLTVLNASVRVVHKEDNFLSYAPADMFSVVLYINQTADVSGNEKMAKTTGELIELTLKSGGRFFLPYQLHYTPEQLSRSYPEIKSFFEAKKQIDPEDRFSNHFYEKYAPLILVD